MVSRTETMLFLSLGINLLQFLKKPHTHHWLIYTNANESETAYAAFGNRRLLELMFRLCWQSQPRHQKGLCNREALGVLGRQTAGTVSSMAQFALKQLAGPRFLNEECWFQLQEESQTKEIYARYSKASSRLNTGWLENAVLKIFMRNCTGDTKLPVTTVIIDRATYLRLKSSGMMQKRAVAFRCRSFKLPSFGSASVYRELSPECKWISDLSHCTCCQEVFIPITCLKRRELLLDIL